MSAPSSTPEPAAFFSYVRADDEHERGYLTELRRALAAEASAQTGEEFLIFQDREDILWGQRWRRRIEESIDSSTVLVAVLTPRFFKSESCKDEWDRFREREEKLGRDDLILPIYFIRVPAFGVASSDPWIAEAANRQYIDWTDLRFEGLSNIEVRKKVAQLAARMIETTSAEGASLPIPEQVEDVDEAPGFIELIAESEEAMPLFGQVIVDFAEEMERLGELASAHTTRIEKANAGGNAAVARLTVVRQIAVAYDEPATRMEGLAAEYVDQLARVDGGIRALIARVPDLTDEDDVEAARSLAVSLKELAGAGREGLGALDGFRESLRMLMQMSSTTRPVLRRIDQAVATIVPSGDVFQEWSDELNAALASKQASAIAQ